MVDACLIALAYYLAFVLRFDAGIPGRYEDLLAGTVAFVVPVKLALFAAFGLYSKLWRFVDQADFESIVKAVVVSSFVLIGLLFLLTPTDADPPRGVIALDFLLTLAFIAGARFLVRAAVERPLRQPLVQRAENEVLIVGAGNGGQQVAPELRRNPELSSAVIGFIDDDPRKQRHARVGLSRARDHRRPAAGAGRHQAGRGRHRDPVGARASCGSRSSPRAGSGTSRCARCPPSSSCSPAAPTCCARCARCRWRTSWGASRCAWRSTAWVRTCAAASCS